MKKRIRKSIIMLVLLVVLTTVGLTRNDIGCWTLDVKGLKDYYLLEMYFENGQTYCNLYNINNGDTYSGQMDIFNPIVKPNGSYGFTITFYGGRIILRGFEQKKEFEGSLEMNNKTYNIEAIGDVDMPNFQNDGFSGNIDDAQSFAFEGHKNLKIIVNAYYNGLKMSNCDNYLRVYINGEPVTDWFFESSRTITAKKGDSIQAVIRYIYSNGRDSEIYCTIPSYRGSQSYILQKSGTFNFEFDATLELEK